LFSAGNAAGSNTVSYMVVAGGGGAGGDSIGGGGGAGGFREGKTPQCSYTQSPIACTSGSNNGLPVTATGYPITVGGGGQQLVHWSKWIAYNRRRWSSFNFFNKYTSAGGGNGGGSRPTVSGGPGGSGGGASRNSSLGQCRIR
jgi:hypothetical protein